MISKLSGTLLENNLTDVVIDVQGVGYQVSVPLSTSESIGAIGASVRLYTLMTVREDDIHLYGFTNKIERQLFTQLTGISGIGPRLALNVLSCMSVDEFAAAVSQQDIKQLSRISGIGKRTAERMVVELKDKISTIGVLTTSATGVPATDGAASKLSVPSGLTPAGNDAILALETLGIKHDIASTTIRKLLADTPNATAESLIHQALRSLNS